MKFPFKAWILNEAGEPIRGTIEQWSQCMENTAARVVRRETIGAQDVSTVFLGIDHNWSGQGAPVLWETMIFGGPHDQKMFRCSGNREQAEAMHADMVKFVNETCASNHR